MVIGFSCVSFESKDAVFQGHAIEYTPVSDDVKQNHNYFCRFLFFLDFLEALEALAALEALEALAALEALEIFLPFALSFKLLQLFPHLQHAVGGDLQIADALRADGHGMAAT